MDTERQTLKIGEAAKVLGISRNTAYDAAKSGELPTVKIGRRLLVPRAALQHMLDSATRVFSRVAEPRASLENKKRLG